MYKDSKALEESIQEFIFTRQEKEGNIFRMLLDADDKRPAKC